jgi:hypothetical protein
MPVHRIVLKSTDFTSKRMHLYNIPEDVPRDARLVLESTNIVETTNTDFENMNMVVRYPHVLNIGEQEDNTNSLTFDNWTYEISTSSTLPGWNAWNLFHGIFNGEGMPNAWLGIGYTYDETPFGAYNSARVNSQGIEPLIPTIPGEYVVLKLPHPVVYKGALIQNGDRNGRASGDYVFVGSKDGVSWDILKEKRFNTFNSVDRIFEESNTEPYQYFGVIIKTIMGGLNGRVGLNEFRIYGESNFNVA